MRRSSVSNDAGGFTLVESSIVVAIVGILSAMAIPSFIAIHQRAKLSQAVESVVSTLRATQAASVRHSRSCSAIFDRANQIIDVRQACLPSNNLILPDPIEFTDTGISDRVKYGMRGNTTSNKTIILGIKNNRDRQKCITISSPLGIIRTGVYDSKNKSCQKASSFS
jgi:prepilin-type N-terminal cleavage/methylation domain-containing protein